jgi:hypothetical protein
MGDKTIASWANQIGTKVLQGREYTDLSYENLRNFSEKTFAKGIDEIGKA